METMPSFLSPSITTHPLLAILEPKSINSLASSFDFAEELPKHLLRNLRLIYSCSLHPRGE